MEVTSSRIKTLHYQQAPQTLQSLISCVEDEAVYINLKVYGDMPYECITNVYHTLNRPVIDYYGARKWDIRALHCTYI